MTDVEEMRAYAVQMLAIHVPAHNHLIRWASVLEVDRARVAELEADNQLLRETIQHIKEYWNGNRTDAAMWDALCHIEQAATLALEPEEAKPYGS